MHDLVIRGGTVVDGTGAPGVRADVAIDGDYIVEIGRVATKGRDEIDADGHAVTPGFIDGHTHMDAQVFWDEIGTCSCWHGVTTVVMGNCGFSLAPSRAGAIDLVIENIERAEDIPRAAMKAGIDWTWETFAEYLDAVDRVPKAINYAAYVGHSALRTWAMGERAFDAAADENALESMIAELRAALQAGAIGFSTSRARNHVTVDDRPVASRLADWTEVRRLVHVMKDVGRGLFEIALDPGLYGVDAEGRRNDFAQLLAITGETRVPTTFGVPPFIPGDDFYLEMLDSAHAVGAPMFGQTHSRGISSITSFKTTLPFDQLPEWRELRRLPHDEQLKRLRDPAVRRRLVSATEDGAIPDGVGTEPRRPDYDKLLVLDSPTPPYRTVSAVARDRGVDPVSAMIELAVETQLDQLFLLPLTLNDPESLLRYMRHPETVMTFSDSGAHVSQVMDSSIQTHLLSYWVRDRGEFALENAVRMLTSVPASRWGFDGRGTLQPGAIADLNVFDPERVGPCLPQVTSDFPANTTRLQQRSTGFAATIVAGVPTIRNGISTGFRPGRLVRDAGIHRSVPER